MFVLEFSASRSPLWETFAAAQPASWSSCHRGTLQGCWWARYLPSLMTLLPHSRLPQGQKHPLIICSLCSHPCRCSSAGGGELCREVAGMSPHVDPGLLPESHRAFEDCLRRRGVNHPRAGWRSEGCVEAAGTVDQALTPRTGGPARSPATADKGLGMLPTAWQGFLHSLPFPILFLKHYCALTASPPRGGCQVWAVCSAPQKADKYRQICHPFPPLSPAERLLSWVGLISWSKPDILENVCSGTEQAGIFISRLHLHCFLSWRGAGGRREEEMCLLRASPRGAQAHPSSPPAPAAVAARDLGRQAPFELLKDQPSWKSQLATIRPFPPTARCAFVWVACLEDSLSLWVARRCSFRRPRRGPNRCPGCPPSKLESLPWSSPGVTKLLFLESICWLMHSFTWCVFTPNLCVADHVSARDPAVSAGGMFSVLWELTLRMQDKEKEEKVIGAGATAVQTTNWRQREGGGGGGAVFLHLWWSWTVSPRRRWRNQT